MPCGKDGRQRTEDGGRTKDENLKYRIKYQVSSNKTLRKIR